MFVRNSNERHNFSCKHRKHGEVKSNLQSVPRETWWTSHLICVSQSGFFATLASLPPFFLAQCFHSRDRRCAEAQFDLPDFWTAFKVTLLGFLSFVVNAGAVWAFWELCLFRLVIGIPYRAMAMMLLSDSVYGHGGDGGTSHRDVTVLDDFGCQNTFESFIGFSHYD